MDFNAGFLMICFKIIIYKNLDYQEALTIASKPTVKQTRIDTCKKLFTQMQNENPRLYKFLPAKQENCHNPFQHLANYDCP